MYIINSLMGLEVQRDLSVVRGKRFEADSERRKENPSLQVIYNLIFFSS
jgi:hypothetical protein